MLTRDGSAEVREYVDLCESLAASLARPGSRGINGVEFDDLVQEGLIAVWSALQSGVAVSARVVKGRMINYQRWLGRHGVSYDELLAIDSLDLAA